jgi:hypothetical protein
MSKKKIVLKRSAINFYISPKKGEKREGSRKSQHQSSRSRITPSKMSIRGEFDRASQKETTKYMMEVIGIPGDGVPSSESSHYNLSSSSSN